MYWIKYFLISLMLMFIFNKSSFAESALDISPVCTKVGQGGEESLLSRTSFCQKFNFEVPVLNNDGFNVAVAKVTGYAYTANNPTNVLNWPVTFRFKTVYEGAQNFIIKVHPRFDCTENECTFAGMPTVPLNTGLSAPITITPTMKVGSGGEQRYYLGIKLYADRSDKTVTTSSFYVNGPTLPTLRCDVSLAKANTKGCVFTDAPAVLNKIKITDPDVNESAIHIKEAQNSGKPGKYVAQSGSVMPDTSYSAPLTRLRDATQRRKNRTASLNMCKANFGSYSSTCAFTGDSDETPQDCDCDEYPFAATNQGADSSGGNVSVKKIDPSDNRRAGAYLGSFFNQERVLDGDEFYVNVD
nr:NucA/NucB deoxyribonuclease domain-containing protein [Acinetobacter sp. Marseille-Q1620]